MYLIANFENSLHVELAITGLEEEGIGRNKILAVPLQSGGINIVFDSINQADGISNLDAAMIIGSMTMVIGTIYGYVLYWGPIIWGLIGLFAGAAIGFALDFFLGKKKNSGEGSEKTMNSVVLLVHCTGAEGKKVKKTLEKYYPLGVGELSREGDGIW